MGNNFEIIKYIFFQIYFVLIIVIYKLLYINEFGLFGDWGLGIGDWGLGPIPNPQSPQNVPIHLNIIIYI